MKKYLLVFLALAMLCGCAESPMSSKHSAQVKDANEVIFTSPNGDSFTKQDEFDNLKKLNISYFVLTEMFKDIGEIEGVDENEVLQNKLEEYVDSIMDEKVAEDKPVKAQIVEFKDYDMAKDCINRFNENNDFEKAAQGAGYNGLVEEVLYKDSNTTLPIEVKTLLFNSPAIGISSIITTLKVENDAEGNEVEVPSYYVLNVISSNVEDFKEEYRASIESEVLFDDIVDYTFKQYDVEFYDESIYQKMKGNYPVFE